jgi:(4S)-4-hydroxy-5-phosphonooxypentane-2,3-dione isomerase
MFVLIVTCYLKPEKSAFLEATMENGRSTLKESGCLHFDVVQDDEDPNLVYFYEVYRDKAANQQYAETPHVKRWIATVKDWVEKPFVVSRGTILSP